MLRSMTKCGDFRVKVIFFRFPPSDFRFVFLCGSTALREIVFPPHSALDAPSSTYSALKRPSDRRRSKASMTTFDLFRQ
jgi:hypothetical protein